ncbi:MAG: hypothetical protein ACRCUG_04405, partial [Yersinia sp. (in: enterobacteria)]
GSAVQGHTGNGTGIDVGENTNLSGGGEDDPLQVTGTAAGDNGTGVALAGFTLLSNTALAGNAAGGHDVEIIGPVTIIGNTTVNGIINGGVVDGNSANRYGVLLNEMTAISEIMIGGNTLTDKLSVFINLLEDRGDYVTINGQTVEENNLTAYIEGDTNTNTNTNTNSQSAPVSPVKKATEDNVKIMQPQEGNKPDSLLMKRNQILSSLEEHALPASIVNEFEHDIAANISVAICIPDGVNTEHESCDTHILGRWKPQFSTSGQK